MTAQELVNEAGENTTLEWESLISQLSKEESISKEDARLKIALAYKEWRRNRPDTFIIRVLRSIAKGTGKPDAKDLKFP